MAAWTNLHSSPAYFSGFGCDMGAYIGPWPLLPPGELTGLSGDEIDFYVALPNPTDTTDVTIVADGTYDTAIWDSWRYETGGTPPTDFGYAGDSTGPSAPFPVPSTMPAGAHLYVVVGSVSAPSNPPEFYVPASYAAGGAAAFETAMGAWSTDQAAYDKTTTVAPASGPSISGSETTTSGSDLNVSATADGLLATLLATTTSGAGIGATITAAKQSGGTDVKVYGESIVNNFDASSKVDPAGTFAYPHAVLDPLLFDLDYSETPYIDAAGDPGLEFAFDVPGDIVPEWGTLTFQGDNITDNAVGGTFPSDYTAFDIPIRVGWDTGTLSPGTGSWTYSGTTLGDFVGAAGGSQNPSFTVDMSSVGDAVFHIYWGQKFLYTGATLATNFAQPLTEADYVRTAAATVAANLPLTVHFPTWRYWIPGAIVPSGAIKWHTVGGHFATVGPAGLQIKTPGVGWVDVVDGPA